MDVECEPEEFPQKLATDSEILDMVQDIRKIQRTSEEREKTMDVFNYVVEIWKTQIYKEWIPLSGHFCNVDNRGANRDTPGACVLDNVVFSLYTTRTGALHPCIADYCNIDKCSIEWASMHHKKVKTYTDIYICTYSGKHHYCGEFCNICKPEENGKTDETNIYEKNLYNSDGILMCPLSGICFKDQKYAPKFDINSMNKYDFEQNRTMYREFNETFSDDRSNSFRKALDQIKSQPSSKPSMDDDSGIKTSKSDFRSSSKNLKLFTGFRRKRSQKDDDHILIAPDDITEMIKVILTSKNRAPINLKKIKRQSSQTMKHFYLTLAAAKIADVLSPIRMVQYEENNEKKTQKLIKPMTAYVNKCYTKHESLNICKLATVVREETKTIFEPPRMMLTIGSRVIYVLDYAKLCVSAWYAIITNTTQGKQEPGSFKYTEFIDAFISMIKRGYSVDLKNGDIVTIYERDNFFAMIPSMDEEERKKGDYTSKYWRKHVATLKKRIQTAISDAIIKENIHNNMLRPYGYNFEKLEEQYFIEIKEWQKTKVQQKKKRAQESQQESELERAEKKLEQEIEEMMGLSTPRKRRKKTKTKEESSQDEEPL